MAGVLYSLVALGFVLIFKASGVFNFAQGAMVLFAALSLARLAGIDGRLERKWLVNCWLRVADHGDDRACLAGRATGAAARWSTRKASPC